MENLATPVFCIRPKQCIKYKAARYSISGRKLGGLTCAEDVLVETSRAAMDAEDSAEELRSQTPDEEEHGTDDV